MITQMHLIRHNFDLHFPEYDPFTESNANDNRYRDIGGDIEKKKCDKKSFYSKLVQCLSILNKFFFQICLLT